MYGKDGAKDWFQREINAGRLLYANTKKTPQLPDTVGLQLPEVAPEARAGFAGSDVIVYRRLEESKGGGDPRILYQGEAPAPVATLTGNELGDFGGDVKALRAAAKAFYKDKLQGTSVENPALGTVRFTKAGKSKFFHSTADKKKLAMLPALAELISKGEYVRSRALNKPRADNIVAFHWIRGTVRLDGQTFPIAVNISEDSNGNKFYNLNHDARGWETENKEASEVSAESKPRAQKPLFQSIPESGDGVNIHILPTEDGAGAPPGATDAQKLAYEGLHEVFARSFEGYLREGKAPSRRLRDTFRMFRSPIRTQCSVNDFLFQYTAVPKDGRKPSLARLRLIFKVVSIHCRPEGRQKRPPLLAL